MRVYELKGSPIPWMRAGRKGNKYYDKQMTEKTAKQWELKSQMMGLYSHSEPLKVTMEFHMPIPKSWAKVKQKRALHKPHSSRPDVDNLLKFVDDSLNSILWQDDAIIYEVHIRKFYSDEPKTRLLVEPYRGEELTPLIEEPQQMHG